MNLRILFTLFAFSSLAAADGSVDEKDLEARQFSGPGCYCCTGYVVENIAGTRCGSGEPVKVSKHPVPFANSLEDDDCETRDMLCCNNGAFVWPPLVSISLLFHFIQPSLLLGS